MKRTILAIVIASTAILPASAQQQFPQQPPPQQQPPQQQQQYDDGAAPEHGVARISLVNGDVSVRRGDSGELSAAALNGPLVVNDHLATGPNGRSEIQFDWGNMIRLGPSTEVRMGELEDRRYLVQIATGTPSDPEYMINAAIPQDQWDTWNIDRDRALERTSSYRYVSPDVAGAEDLDTYGRWTTDPQYGNVWVPYEDPGWAPYRAGRWVYEDFYGWTWVSDDPWGWAPYHYGNWYMSSFGWAWYPGPIYGRHYWRPAMVGFFGWGVGGGVGFGFGFGNVGWVPLAPFERFHAWYGRGIGGTSIVNNIAVASTYRNARSVNGRNGVTSIAAADFGRGRAINSNNFVRASSTDLARAGSVQGRLPFTASADARRVSNSPVNTQSMPRVSDNTRFAQRSPAQGGSQGFSQGQGRQAQIIGGQSSARPAVIGGGNSNGNTGGWRTFEGNRSNTAPAQSQSMRQNEAPRQNVQQPVRISPSIVRERGPAPAVSRPPAPSGGFGAPRPQSSPQRSGGGGNRGGGGGHKR